jgi:microcystin-dependent protein
MSLYTPQFPDGVDLKTEDLQRLLTYSQTVESIFPNMFATGILAGCTPSLVSPSSSGLFCQLSAGVAITMAGKVVYTDVISGSNFVTLPYSATSSQTFSLYLQVDTADAVPLTRLDIANNSQNVATTNICTVTTIKPTTYDYVFLGTITTQGLSVTSYSLQYSLANTLMHTNTLSGGLYTGPQLNARLALLPNSVTNANMSQIGIGQGFSSSSLSWSGSTGWSVDALNIRPYSITSYQLSAIGSGNSAGAAVTTATIADGAVTASKLSIPGYNIVPVGTIMLWTSPNAPSGWLACDGTMYANSQYPLLANALSSTFDPSSGTTPQGYFNVPDLRGIFVRGYDPRGSGIGSRDTENRPFGVIQSSALQDHTHPIWMTPSSTLPFPGPGHTHSGNNKGYPAESANPSGPAGSSSPSSATEMIGTGSLETRPMNLNLLYIIAAQ